MYNLIAKHIMAPVLDFARGTTSMKCLEKLEQSQWWSRDKILDLQNERLRQLVRYAYDNVPYYRRIFSERDLQPNDIESSENLVKLPVLTKQLIRDNFDYLRARNFPSKELIPNSTSGSTGEPLQFYNTRDDSYHNWGFAATQRAYGWAGYEIGDKNAWIRWPSTPKSTVDKFIQIFERTMFLDAAEMATEKLPLLVRKLEDFQPKVIRGYPSTIYLLARFVEREGKGLLRPKSITTFGEQLYDYQRDLYSKVFQCDTYDYYGSHEVCAIACECSEHSGYHIAAENHIVETVDNKNGLVPVGEEGRILVTSLHNYAMPFIRYDIGDVGVSSDKTCLCGRGLPLLTKLNGRTYDIILTRSGRCIPGIALPQRFLASLDVEQFQVVQETYEEVVVRLVLGKEYTQERKNKLTSEIKSQYRPILGEDVNITTEFVDQILLTSAGKRRVVISKLPARSGLDLGPSP